MWEGGDGGVVTHHSKPSVQPPARHLRGRTTRPARGATTDWGVTSGDTYLQLEQLLRQGVQVRQDVVGAQQDDQGMRLGVLP